MFALPRTATAPFCPSEVKGSVGDAMGLPLHKKLLRYAGPGLRVSVGYMDPGNWATDIESGSRFGYGLLFVVLLASLAAMLLQTLCVRLGLVAQKDLARLCREQYSPGVNRFLWLGAELAMAQPNWLGVAIGFIPSLERLQQPGALYLAIGIVGATVMPHNLYLHTSIVQTRRVHASEAGLREALRFTTLDTLVSLSLALLVNAAIMVLAASAFNSNGHRSVTDIADAYHLIEPVVGSAVAASLFAIALLASGQSSTFTGTIAGQIVMEGFLDLKIPCWQRRLLTRVLALVPAFIGVWWLGEDAIGKMLVLSQVVLSFQLPFAMWPLIRFTSSRALMGRHASGPLLKLLAWALFATISAANVWLVVQVVF